MQLSTVQNAWANVHWQKVFSKEWFQAVGSAGADLVAFYQSQPAWVEAGVVVVPLLTAAAVTLYSISFPDQDYRKGMEPYVRGVYDPIQAQAYYARHKFLVLQRLLQLLRMSNKFVFNLAIDKYIFRDEEKQRSQRADELLKLITNLGPTAIKVGQALSVRPDLIPEEYATALSTLQDQVPPFEGLKAKALLREQLGEERFSHLKNIGLESSKGPVASASIGQVYRGFIDDKEVAIKVQRPNVLADIALDLYIVREFAPIYQKFSGGATDLQALANEWGRGFIAELDYRSEAANTIRFNVEMKKRNLNAVIAPTVVSAYSTEQILVTEWVDGTRLDQSDADDVPRLCAVALNAYLVMLLELQSLHCDPHPGRKGIMYTAVNASIHPLTISFCSIH
jgi:predicted unusual protein kinase regulating ubiquinone biosynthesis (AarF/ABC1/UbiB family)